MRALAWSAPSVALSGVAVVIGFAFVTVCDRLRHVFVAMALSVSCEPLYVGQNYEHDCMISGGTSARASTPADSYS
jgi:hypothetical protein